MTGNAEDPCETRLSGAVIPIHARAGSGAEGGGETPWKHHDIRQAASGRYRTMYGLPDVLAEQLDAEAAALGKARREYIIHLLSQHAAELLKRRPPAKRPGGTGKR
jgi:hypothetical protein